MADERVRTAEIALARIEQKLEDLAASNAEGHASIKEDLREMKGNFNHRFRELPCAEHGAKLAALRATATTWGAFGGLALSALFAWLRQRLLGQ